MLSGMADEMLEAAIVEGLRLRKMDVATAQERRLRRKDDELLLEIATLEGRLMITRDQDFLRIHHEWMVAGRHHAGIMFLTANAKIGKAVREVLLFATTTSPADAVDTLKFI